MNLDEAKELLPWYAAGALDAAEKRAVESALHENPQLQRELEELRALHANVGDVQSDEPAFRPDLIKEAYRRIDAYENARSPQQSGPRSITTIVADALDQLLGGWNRTPMLARAALAAQFAIVAALAVLLMLRPAEQISRTASGANTAPGQATITIVFQPQASMAQIESVLAGVDAQIVSGPSAQQSYALALRETDSAHIERAIAALRAQSELVRYAARIDK